MIDIKEHIAFIRSLAEWDTAKISDWAEEHIHPLRNRRQKYGDKR